MFDIFIIFSWLKKNFQKKDVLLIFLIIAVYFLTRLVNIEKLPIFTDEGIYIHWAKVAWHDATWRFVSLTDGRQPLQTWATIPLLKLFPNNAFLAGRLFGVLTGFLGLTGLFFLIYYLFGKKAAYIGSVFYLFTPYFLFYDRMALMDSGINAAFIWILFFSLVLIRSLRFDIALILGIVSGISLLAKSSTQLFVALSALAPIATWQKKFVFKKLLNFIFLYIVVIFLAFAIYNVQRLSPFLHFVAEKNKTFIYTLPELLKNPLGGFKFNFYIIPYYVLTEAGFFLTLIGPIGWFLLFKKDKRLGLYLGLWALIPYLVVATVARVLYPRYIIFFASLLSIFITYLLITFETRRKNFIAVALILFFLSIFYFDYSIIFNYKNVPFPPIDRGQYIDGSSNGYGIKEIVDYVRVRSQQKPAIILAEGNFGLAGDVIDVFLRRDDRIFVKSYWPFGLANLLENQKELDKNLIYAVFVYRNDFPKSWPLKLLQSYTKPGGKSTIYLFQLTP